MKKLFLKLNLFIVIFIVTIITLCYISSVVVSSRDFKNYETESNLLVMKENEQFDLAFVGISHARNFSRHKNHLRIEQILNKRIFNFGQGEGACSVNEQYAYLDYFYKNGNKVNTIFYVLTPPMIFSETLPKASNTFNKEPFKLDFFINYLINVEAENKTQRLFYYTRTKLASAWLNYKPNSKDSMPDKLYGLDSVEVNKGIKTAYTGNDLSYFDSSCKTIEQTIVLAQKNNSKVIFFIPPALFGKWQGHQKVYDFAKNMESKYNIKIYDYAETVLEPQLYYDHHHLNTNGVLFFTEKYLKPIVY